MSGEKQPGGREPAPGELGLLQAFLNTHYDLESHGGEVLSGPDELRSWLAGRRLIAADAPVSAGDVARVIAIRETLRDLIGGRADHAALAELQATVRIRLEPGRPRLEPTERETIDGAIAGLIAIVATEMLGDRWSRLKVCPGVECGWAFYDHSRNRSGRWCSMSICGGRAKARAHYRRRRGA
jgi:predicted RNA-binding Zn ribbon-like protein